MYQPALRAAFKLQIHTYIVRLKLSRVWKKGGKWTKSRAFITRYRFGGSNRSTSSLVTPFGWNFQHPIRLPLWVTHKPQLTGLTPGSALFLSARLLAIVRLPEPPTGIPITDKPRRARSIAAGRKERGKERSINDAYPPLL